MALFTIPLATINILSRQISAASRALDKLPDSPVKMSADFSFNGNKASVADVAKKVGDTLDETLHRLKTSDKPFKLAGDHVHLRILENFTDKQTPDGKSWEPLSEMRPRLRQWEGVDVSAPTMRVSEQLKRASSKMHLIHGRGVEHDRAVLFDPSVTFGKGSKKMRSAFAHQRGVGAGRNPLVRDAGSAQGVLPARPYMGLTSKDEAVIRQIFVDWIIEDAFNSK